VHVGLFAGIKRLRADVSESHARQDIVVNFQEITSFYSWRPDGVAFDGKNKHCVFLEFTRTMDSVTFSEEGDWTERKELEKNVRYGMHIYFINHLSALHGRPWNCTQANFTVGAWGSLKQTQFQDRLRLLGVTNSTARDKIRVLTVSKTLALLDIIRKLITSPFCVAPSRLLALFRRNWPTRKRQHSNSSKKSPAHSVGW
jgi:hypothetical protein